LNAVITSEYASSFDIVCSESSRVPACSVMSEPLTFRDNPTRMQQLQGLTSVTIPFASRKDKVCSKAPYDLLAQEQKLEPCRQSDLLDALETMTGSYFGFRRYDLTESARRDLTRPACALDFRKCAVFSINTADLRTEWTSRSTQSLDSLQSDLRSVESLRRDFVLTAASVSEGRADS